MSDQGVFTLHRGIFDHPMFAPEPFTEREAWIWMLSAAAWADKRVRVGKAMVDLKRGQLAFATRFLAVKWQWTDSRVRRFLKRLETDAMVTVLATREATQVTICNYDQYQFGRRSNAAQNDAQNEAQTTHERRKEEETNNLKTDVADAAPRGSGLVTPEALVLSEKLLVIAGHSPKFWPPGWCGAGMRVQTWLNQGWKPEIIVAAVTGAAARKRGPPANSVQFFENAVAEEVARQSAPLPTVEIREAEKVVSYGHGKHNPNSVIAAIDRQLAAIQKADGIDLEVPESPVLRISSGPVR